MSLCCLCEFALCVCLCVCMCVCLCVSSGIIQSMFDSQHTPEMATRMKHKPMNTLYIRTHVYTSTHFPLYFPPQTAHKDTPSTWHTLHTHIRLPYKRKHKQNKRNCWTITYWNSASWCYLLQQWVWTVNTPPLKKQAATPSLQQLNFKVTLPFHITNFEPVSKTFWTGCVHMANTELRSMTT